MLCVAFDRPIYSVEFIIDLWSIQFRNGLIGDYFGHLETLHATSPLVHATYLPTDLLLSEPNRVDLWGY